jgi:hypothetical protein
MDFERANILKPILDELAAKDQVLFSRILESILMEHDASVLQMSSRTQHILADAFKEELTKRRDDLLSEMHRVLEGAQ